MAGPDMSGQRSMAAAASGIGSAHGWTCSWVRSCWGRWLLAAGLCAAAPSGRSRCLAAGWHCTLSIVAASHKSSHLCAFLQATLSPSTCGTAASAAACATRMATLTLTSCCAATCAAWRCTRRVLGVGHWVLPTRRRIIGLGSLPWVMCEAHAKHSQECAVDASQALVCASQAATARSVSGGRKALTDTFCTGCCVAELLRCDGASGPRRDVAVPRLRAQGGGRPAAAGALTLSVVAGRTCDGGCALAPISEGDAL